MAHRPTVRAANGLVATGHHLATAAGLAALRDGGTAADAAVAAAAVCAVVLPQATSIGGDVFALHYDARSGEVTAYNGSGAAAEALPEFTAFPDSGAQLATVPGCVAAWADLLDDRGKLGLEAALQAAIGYAEVGFPVSDGLSSAIAESRRKLDRDPESARTFVPRGRTPEAGTMLQQPDLAATLREIASDGAETFYRGALAERLARGIAASGGTLTADDLAAHATERKPPLEIAYRGLRVFGQPPVSQGHILLEELLMAEGFPLAEHAALDPELIHLMVELKKLAFADRDAHAGDPRSVDFDAARLFDPAFIEARRKHVGSRAAERAEAGALALPAHTTYLCAVDRDGNAVSLIESVFSLFGSGAIVPGTGVLLNNRLTGFSLDPRSPNALVPGKRPVHTLNAVMVLDGSQPRYVLGTPGAQAQVQTNFQLLVSLIDHGLDVQEAIELPRWFHEAGRTLSLEARYPDSTRRALQSKGHELVLLPEWAEVTGGAQAIAIDESGGFAGGADPRREGYAAGY
ncbi:MAG TPA: gamma-glutamyltransferase [Candidatus Limnocylindria bacterium]|nr:gamma-glutamyltransferase [Candidatus Limnocylindria bacterium]